MYWLSPLAKKRKEERKEIPGKLAKEKTPPLSCYYQYYEFAVDVSRNYSSGPIRMKIKILFLRNNKDILKYIHQRWTGRGVTSSPPRPAMSCGGTCPDYVVFPRSENIVFLTKIWFVETSFNVFQMCWHPMWNSGQPNEGTIWGDTVRFISFIPNLIEYNQIVKTWKGFLPMSCLSKITATCLYCSLCICSKKP